MKSYLRVFGVALIGAGLWLGYKAPLPTPAVTDFPEPPMGSIRKPASAARSSRWPMPINEYKKAKKLGQVTVTAMRAKPQPYWRDSVWDELYYKPDIVKSNSYTICWHGVVSPYVCTSGAKVCW